jgi:N utilization substance protein B
MSSRRRAREAAAQILYQLEASGEDAAAALALYWDNLGSLGNEDRAFTESLVLGVAGARDELDAKIREISKHWRLERMARVDRNILRLATYELMLLPEIPARVTLNEAVELAKRFGNEDSPAFVNGVLDRLASDLGKH